MDYQLLWASRLWTVSVPAEIAAQSRWTYVQAFVVSGGSHGSAMRAALQHAYPGLGYGPPSKKPISVTAVGGFSEPLPAIAAPVSEPCKSSPSSFSNNHSQTPTPPGPAPSATYGGSGTSGPRKPAPRSATSIPSAKNRGGPVRHGRPPRPTLPASTDKGGWKGSSPTKPAAA